MEEGEEREGEREKERDRTFAFSRALDGSSAIDARRGKNARIFFFGILLWPLLK